MKALAEASLAAREGPAVVPYHQCGACTLARAVELRLLLFAPAGLRGDRPPTMLVASTISHPWSSVIRRRA
jgi:hypothetical protein